MRKKLLEIDNYFQPRKSRWSNNAIRNTWGRFGIVTVEVTVGVKLAKYMGAYIINRMVGTHKTADILLS